MKTRTLIAGLVSGIVSFIVNALSLGVLLGTYYQANTIHYDGLFKNPPVIWALILGNISWSLLISYVLSFRPYKSKIDDVIVGMVVCFFIMTGIALHEYGTKNLSANSVILLEIVIQTLVGGIRGLVAGRILRRK